MYRVFLNELQRNAKNSIKAKLNKYTTKSNLLEVNIKEQLEYAQTIDEEKCELFDNITILNRKIDNFQHQLNAKDSENV